MFVLIAGREAGDVHPGGRGHWIGGPDATTLSDLGIQSDLAADAVMLAQVPDEVWMTWDQSASRPQADDRTRAAAHGMFDSSLGPVDEFLTNAASTSA